MSLAIIEILGLLGKLGVNLDPGSIGKEKLKAKFDKVASDVVERLENDKITPARLSDNDEEKTQLIRAAEFVLWKETIISVTGRSIGSGRGADAIRDRHDDKVVPVVMPKVTATMTTAELVAAVAEAELELTT